MHATTLGVTPSLGLSGIEPETSLALAGDRTLTTAHGTLKFRYITVFDSARGEFAEIDRVTGGTEKFENATGTLWLTGTGTRAAGFESKITGRICTNRTSDRD